MSCSTVSDYVAIRRPQIQIEYQEGRRHLAGMVSQVHLPGEEAEVDFADVWIRLAGEVTKCHLFTLRMSYSGKAVHGVYASQAQESFMQGHVEAFNVLGGVPSRHIRYPAQAAPQLNHASTFGKAVSHSLRLRPQVIARWGESGL